MMDIDTNESKLKFNSVKSFVISGLSKNELDFKIAIEKFSGNDEIVKSAFDHSFRIYVLENLKNMEIEDMKNILNISILACQKKLCLPTTPIFIINDMLSSLTIEKCSELFCYLEDSSQILKSDLFYSSVKNYLLRMCNDLLKRLSKSQNTVFSGRIHLFLAKLFPLNEKSGLNLMSHFSDNFTRYTTTPDAFEEAINKVKSESMETDKPEDQEVKIATHAMPIDYNLYTKFWSLQEFFSKPNNCFDKPSWKTFTNNANEVLEALKSYRLEDVKEINQAAKVEEFDDMNLYFSKYLTSEKLLDLQLNDSNFRRQILIQFLILFQYLNAEVKFKSNYQVLSEDQNSWVRSAIKRVQELLKETPPSGSKFNSNVKHVLEREEIWNKWKNEGCPNYVKEKKTAPVKPSKRPRPVSADFVINSNKVFVSDNSEMSKLCSVNHGNLEACKDPNRQFLPSLKEFFEEAIEQLDPANQVEKQYLLFNNTEWAWKALRLLAKRSAFYFMQNQNVKTISEYLEAICNKLNKEFTAENQQNQQLNQSVQPEQNQQTQNTLQDNQEAQQNQADAQQMIDNNEIDSNDNENSQLGNDDEAVQLNDDQSTNVNSSITNQTAALNAENDISKMIIDKVDDTDTLINPTSEKKRKIDPDLIKIEKKTISRDDFDSELIKLISDNTNTIQEWKEIAVDLKMDEDTISFIESEPNDVKEQCKKILQLWKEREEKKAFPSIVLKALKNLSKTDLASKFEEKLNERD